MKSQKTLQAIRKENDAKDLIKKIDSTFFSMFLEQKRLMYYLDDQKITIRKSKQELIRLTQIFTHLLKRLKILSNLEIKEI